MLLEADHFCQVLDVERFLQLEIAEEKVGAVARAISEATQAIKEHCEQEIVLVESETIVLDVVAGMTRLYLPELPIVVVIEVVEDGEPLVEGPEEDYQLGQYGVLHRIGAEWAVGVQIVEVTYSHGNTTVPEGVRNVCARAASRVYQAGLRSAESGGLPGVSSLSLGDYSVGWSAEGGGGVSEGVLGASAARQLLLSEKDALDRWRLRSL